MTPDKIGEVVDDIHYNRAGRAHGRILVGQLITAALAQARVEAVEQAKREQVDQWLENELADYRMVMDHCSRTYLHFTDGRVSKPNTYPEEVFAVAAELEEERTQEVIAEARAEEREACAQCVGSLKGGYSASLHEDVLLPDEDGPWVLNSDAAKAIRTRAAAEGIGGS